MADEILASVENGKLTGGYAEAALKTANNSLGKEAFLQLLVTQMQYQDPLNPSTDTEFVAQLAQFSALEQMQNLSQTALNSQAFSLVGKEVIIKVTSESTGAVSYKQGTVDYVTIKNGEAKICVDNELYDMDELYTVIDDMYAVSKLIPTVEEKSVEYDHGNPTDLQVKISLGVDDYQASSVAVFINGDVIDSKYLSYDKESGTLTISKDAFSKLDAGKYQVGFLFDDILTTTVTDKVTLTVTGIKPEDGSEDGSGDTDTGEDNTEDTEGKEEVETE